MMTKEEQGFSNEFRLTRLAAKIIKANLDKPFIVIGNLIVRDFHSQGVVIKVDRKLPTIKDILKAHNMESALFSHRYAVEIGLKASEEAGYVAVEPLIGSDNAIT